MDRMAAGHLTDDRTGVDHNSVACRLGDLPRSELEVAVVDPLVEVGQDRDRPLVTVEIGPEHAQVMGTVACTGGLDGVCVLSQDREELCL